MAVLSLPVVFTSEDEEEAGIGFFTVTADSDFERRRVSGKFRRSVYVKNLRSAG